MNVKKAIKRIAALAGATTMVTATIMGAAAYDLSDYPMPFVENGVFNGKIVVGSTAKTSDVVGAIDIAASLQADSATPVDVSGNEGIVSVTGGVQVKSSSEDFNFGDALNTWDSGVFDDNDFPDLLADGMVEDDDGGSYDFEQTITLGDAALGFAQNDDYGAEPVYYLDLGGATNKYIEYQVHFKDVLDATDLTDSETIEMFGKTYTFDPDNADGQDFVLYGSDTTVVINQGEPVTVEVGDVEYTIEVLGGNSDFSTANIRVTGEGTTSTKSLTSGDSKKMAGLDIYVEDIFISNIGENSIAVSIFVGSNKIVIPNAAESWTELEINDVTDTKIDGYLAASSGHAGDAVLFLQDIYFRVNPTDFDNPAINDDWNWLVMGENGFEDPLFDFQLDFTGMSPSLESRKMTEIGRSGDVYELTFTNNDGDEVKFELFEAPTATTLTTGDGGNVKFTATSFSEDEFFILEDTEAKVSDRSTYVFEITDINQGDGEVTLKGVGSGSSETYENGEEIEDTGVYAQVYGGNFHLRNSANSSNVNSLSRVVVDGGMVVTFGTIGTDAGEQKVNVTFLEDVEDEDEQSVEQFYVTIEGDSSDDIVMSSASWNVSSYGDTDESGDIDYEVSSYGTFVEQERDNSGEYLRVWYGTDETDFNIFLNGPDAVVIRSGSSDGGTAYMINDFVVGQVAVLDTDAAGLLGDDNLIVVGGPCVNTVAMNLMGNPEDCTEGFMQGKGKIKLFSEQNALLVAGYSADDTVGASYVLADYSSYGLSGNEVEVITTDLTNLEVNVVA